MINTSCIQFVLLDDRVKQQVCDGVSGYGNHAFLEMGRSTHTFAFDGNQFVISIGRYNRIKSCSLALHQGCSDQVRVCYVRTSVDDGRVTIHLCHVFGEAHVKAQTVEYTAFFGIKQGKTVKSRHDGYFKGE